MPELEKKKLANNILECLWPQGEGSPKPFAVSSTMFMRHGIWISLTKDEEAEFHSALDKLLGDNFLRQSYSKAALRASMEDLLVSLVRANPGRPSEDTVNDEVKTWYRKLKEAKSKTVTYFALIDKLKMVDDLQVGSALLEPFTETAVGKLRSHMFGQIDQVKHLNFEQKEETKRSLDHEYYSKLRPDECTCLISISIDAREVGRGLELALVRFREVVALLRFLSVIFPGANAVDLCHLRGEASPGEKWYFAHLESEASRIFNQDFARHTPLGNAQREKFDRVGFSSFSAILAKAADERSDVETRLIRAILWIGDAVGEESEDTRFLKFCIAVESLLCGRGDEPLASVLGERLAFILGSDFNSRRDIFKSSKSCYNIRSAIVHEGAAKQRRKIENLLPQMTAYALQAVVAVNHLRLEQNWQRLDELIAHVERLKFDSPGSQPSV